MIGKVIRYMRKQKKYKQEVLGQMIKVKGNTITQYEKGQRNLEAFLKDRVPKREKVLVLKTKDGFRKTKKN